MMLLSWNVQVLSLEQQHIHTFHMAWYRGCHEKMPTMNDMYMCTYADRKYAEEVVEVSDPEDNYAFYSRI